MSSAKPRPTHLKTRFGKGIRSYLLSVAMIGLTALACAPLSGSEGYHVVSLLLLLVVSFLATFMGIGPVLVASTLSSLLWNYFFIPPQFTFHIDKAEDLLMFGMFFIIALINGVLTTRVRHQKLLAYQREERANALFLLSHELSNAKGRNEVIAIAKKEIERYFHVAPLFILQDGEHQLVFNHKADLPFQLTDNDQKRIIQVFENGNTEDIKKNDSQMNLYLLKGTKLDPGVLAIRPDASFPGDNREFWQTFLTQISSSLEREYLAEIAQKARFLDESERLYKTLFNSLSHELRIPIATIMGASDSLLSAELSANVKNALVTEIFSASVRLNHLVENLLNMSRIENGKISLHLDWHDINDLVNKVTDDLKDELKPFNLVVSVPEDMPLVRMDFALMEQVLFNIIYNSCQQAPANSDIRLTFSFRAGVINIEISDGGPGFPEDALNDVFMKFFRVKGSKTGGLGLGLSIVKGFVEAHNGMIKVRNLESGGACFTISIPSEGERIESLTAETNE